MPVVIYYRSPLNLHIKAFSPLVYLSAASRLCEPAYANLARARYVFRREREGWSLCVAS